MNQKPIEAAKQMRIWCDQNYKTRERGSIKKKAKEYGISATSLNHWFKKLYETTPDRHMLDLRVRDAMMEIKTNKNKGIERIAMDHGFNSAGHLGQIMKTRCGMGSFEFRRWLKTKEQE